MMSKGEPDKDLLGYNQNAGEMIVLKLRTDNVKGFRPYHDLINTLIHELTHNVWGPHDHNFWKFFGELKAQYMKFHRFWSHNGNSTSGANDRFEGFIDDEDEKSSGFGHVLGGASAGSLDPALARQKFLDQAEASFSAATCSCCGKPDPTVDGFCGTCKPTSAAAEADSSGPDSGAVMEVDPVSLEADQADSNMNVDDPAAGVCESGQTEVPEPQLTTPTDAEASGDTAAATEAVVLTPSEMDVDASGSGAASGSQASANTLEASQESIAAEPAEPEQQPEPDNDPGSSAEVVATSAAIQDLEITDLEGCGLDGTMLWLQRFRTHLEKLWAMQPKGRAAVEIVLRLVRNILDHPYDEKFRRIRADNPKIQAALLGGDFKEFSEAIMTLLGFERTTDNAGQSFFVLGDKTFDCVKLQMGKELLESQLQPQLAQ